MTSLFHPCQSRSCPVLTIQRTDKRESNLKRFKHQNLPDNCKRHVSEVCYIISMAFDTNLSIIYSWAIIAMITKQLRSFDYLSKINRTRVHRRKSKEEWSASDGTTPSHEKSELRRLCFLNGAAWRTVRREVAVQRYLFVEIRTSDMLFAGRNNTHVLGSRVGKSTLYSDVSLGVNVFCFHSLLPSRRIFASRLNVRRWRLSCFSESKLPNCFKNTGVFMSKKIVLAQTVSAINHQILAVNVAQKKFYTIADGA